MKCKHCGVSFDRQILIALMEMCGASSSREPSWCPKSDDNKHEFVGVSEK